MSRVAKAPITLPANVEVKIENGTITVKGPKGTLTQKVNKLVSITTNPEDSKKLLFGPAANDPDAWAQAGTARAYTSNMIKGVTEGFSLTLELVGVGYRAQSKGSDAVVLSLGYSHTIDYKAPAGVQIETPNNTTIILKGLDKQKVGQAGSDIRRFRPPEPYKGKGVRYAGEVIVKKDAKKK